jgi:hypothetical protein
VYDAVSNRVFTLNGDAHSSTVIDPVAGRVASTIPLGGKPEYGAAAGDGMVYANITDNSEVVEINAKTMTVARRWPTDPCKQPVSMAIDAAHHRLFRVCRSGVMAVSDYASGKIVATLPIGQGVDGAGYDAASANAFASNVDGTLTVIHQDSADAYHVLETVATGPAARNMGLDPVTHRIFLASAKFGPAPAATAANPRPRPPVLPGSFVLLVVERAAPPAAAADVPAIVVQAYQTKFPGRRAVEWKKKNDGNFEAEFTLNGVDIAAKFSPAGRWLETETTIAAAAVPKAVAAAMARDFKGYTITETQRLEDVDQRVLIEIHLENAKEILKTQFEPGGKLVSRSAKPKAP